MPQFTITEATATDVEQIRRLMARVIEHDVTQDEKLLAETLANVNSNVDFWLGEPERCVHLVAALSERTVGVVLVKDFWNLCTLFIESEFQRHGLGRELLEAAAVRCKGRSERAALYLNAAAQAIPFYRKLGFTEREAARPLPPGFMAMQRPL